MWTKPSAARLTGGAWSPTKISVFFTTRIDGYVEVWVQTTCYMQNTELSLF